MVSLVNKYRGSDIEANGLSGAFFVREEYADNLERQLNSVRSMACMLEEREWAEHAGKGPIAERLESAITEIHNELDAQRLRADTAEAALAKFEGEIVAALPGVRFMDSPDGGSPTLGEQVLRMAEALAAAEQRIAILSKALTDIRENSEDIGACECAADALKDAALNPKPEAGSHE